MSFNFIPPLTLDVDRGNKAFGAYRKLKNEGFPCALTIIGSVPSELAEEDSDLTITSLFG